MAKTTPDDLFDRLVGSVEGFIGTDDTRAVEDALLDLAWRLGGEPGKAFARERRDRRLQEKGY